MSAPIRTKIARDISADSDLNQTPERIGKVAVVPAVVRTLKPPPEIWELVHPVPPKQFNPGQAFLERLTSSATSLILMAIAVGFVLGVCVAVLRLGGVQKFAAMEAIQPLPKTQVGATSGGRDTTNLSPNSSAPVETTVKQPTELTVNNHLRETTSPSSKRKGSRASEVQPPDVRPARSETATDVGVNLAPGPSRSQVLPTATTQRSTRPSESPPKSSSDPTSAKSKSNTGLSPQLIAPLKSDSAPKAKVIQWP